MEPQVRRRRRRRIALSKLCTPFDGQPERHCVPGFASALVGIEVSARPKPPPLVVEPFARGELKRIVDALGGVGQAAARVGCSVTTISRVHNRKRNPSQRLAQRIRQVAAEAARATQPPD
jgi:hypothetical protein